MWEGWAMRSSQKTDVSWGSYLGVEGGGSGKTRGLLSTAATALEMEIILNELSVICGPIYEAAVTKSHHKITTITEMRI
jgi:hypothetical protein